MITVENIKILFFALVQGITELLPISSSGHLILLGKILNTPTPTEFITTLHLGTTLAIILFYWKELFKDIFSKKKFSFYTKIVVSSIPAAVAGFLIQDLVDEYLHDVWIIGVSLIVWGIFFIILEKKEKGREDISVEEVSWKDSLVMGFGQVLALIPGTSRSGITTISGIFSGLSKNTSIAYSFILGVPVLLGSFLIYFVKAMMDIDNFEVRYIGLSLIKILPGTLVAFVTGYLALLLLKKIKKSNWLTVFGIYRIILGLVILAILLL